jgi:hypothetical protein
MAAGKNNPQLQQRVAAAAAVGLGPNANWAQINAATAARQQQQAAAAQQAAQQAQAAEYQKQVAARNAQVEAYNRQLAERMEAIRQQEEAAKKQRESTPAEVPTVPMNRSVASVASDAEDRAGSMVSAPDAESIFGNSERQQKARRAERSSSRRSLLAGNTGGYNPATGGGRLGGRSLLG